MATELAPYAALGASSRGRRYPEPAPRYRSEYQRDRDRVLHSAAFRRLEYKTQVFVNHEGDMFRTRLTHSLEVAQIARTVARELRLDEDLTEAICLAHDLGHTPFGHAGQTALDRCMRGYGGFEHNFQSLRVVEALEERYAAFPGLNLTFEAREGILKSCAPEKADRLGAVAARFIHGGQPSLEAQLANFCDEVAYNHHDIDDGLRSGLLSVESVRELAAFDEPYREVLASWPELGERRIVHEVVRRMIGRAVGDLIETTRARVADSSPHDIDAVRAEPEPLVGFSAETRARYREVKRYLHSHLYRHPRVQGMTTEAKDVIERLMAAYREDPERLPASVREAMRSASDEARGARHIADYIAGMTDRFALAEFERLIGERT